MSTLWRQYWAGGQRGQLGRLRIPTMGIGKGIRVTTGLNGPGLREKSLIKGAVDTVLVLAQIYAPGFGTASQAGCGAPVFSTCTEWGSDYTLPLAFPPTSTGSWVQV